MAANEDSFRYTMLRCFLMQAAVASWIESLRHRAIDICIDFNEVSYIFRQGRIEKEGMQPSITL